MEIKEYLEKSARTESIPEGGLTIRGNASGMLATTVSDIGTMERMADHLKRNLFYKKPDAFLDQDQLQDGVLLTQQEAQILHACLGLLTETAELVAPLINGVMAKSHELDATNVLEELGDIDWYRAILLREFKLDEGEIRQRNIDKLAARYPDKFSSDRALNRDLEAERKILEGVE